MRRSIAVLLFLLLPHVASGQTNQALLQEAREHAKAGRLDAAFAVLGRVTQPAPALVAALAASEDFKSLRGDARFEPLVQKLTPCASAEYHQFDFWLGEWEVRGPNGQLLGHNEISKRHGGCVVQEEWTGSQGGSGTSFNFYDLNTKLWHQFWVDASGVNWISSDKDGNPTTQRGSFRDGAMRLSSDPGTIASIGRKRATFRPLEDGRVHQVYEASTDGGKTWSVTFDGYYSRKKKP